MASVPQLKQDFLGRVRNFALGPSTPGNALIPVFEAVQNAIQAIADEFKGSLLEYIAK